MAADVVEDLRDCCARRADEAFALPGPRTPRPQWIEHAHHGVLRHELR